MIAQFVAVRPLVVIMGPRTAFCCLGELNRKGRVSRQNREQKTSETESGRPVCTEAQIGGRHSTLVFLESQVRRTKLKKERAVRLHYEGWQHRWWQIRLSMSSIQQPKGRA